MATFLIEKKEIFFECMWIILKVGSKFFFFCFSFVWMHFLSPPPHVQKEINDKVYGKTSPSELVLIFLLFQLCLFPINKTKSQTSLVKMSLFSSKFCSYFFLPRYFYFLSNTLLIFSFHLLTLLWKKKANFFWMSIWVQIRIKVRYRLCLLHLFTWQLWRQCISFRNIYISQQNI